MDVYAENILDHYRHPRGKSRIPSPSVEHEEVNIACGDALTIFLSMNDGKVEEAGWDGTGCAISQASMSLLMEELAGKTEEEIAALRQEDVYALLGVPIGPRRFKCALLALHTLKNELRKLHGDPPQSWLDTVDLEEDERR